MTAIELRLFPVKELYAGWLIFPMERAEEVLNAWREWVDTVPDEVTSVGRLLQVPPLPDIPEPLRGRRLVVVEAAMMMDEAEASHLLRPLRKLGPRWTPSPRSQPPGCRSSTWTRRSRCPGSATTFC